ncbi:uncharacterized protein LOC120277687 [Dioscorea cayenensis subsp. rotundata]|uniref:Uncharacterized protein LOC120277687 n=1 Tax=Dioscorea cayennensis subsp. rotundata TaxID=55577 RepID=A0AB40CK70_DIOCR|nr:uncharacterized protein LOC120277687 [Dioscorea cayenensis subsp. rotundata]
MAVEYPSLPFYGHDESLSSLNKGNFLEMLEWYSLRNDNVFRLVNQNAPVNDQMTSPKIQKELANACAIEITCAIVDDIEDKCFSLMIDEARDVSVKEQTGVVLRYLSKNGYVIEWFLAMVHVPNTSAISLKNAIDYLFAKHGFSLSRLRGQGYDGASNMRRRIQWFEGTCPKRKSIRKWKHHTKGMTNFGNITMIVLDVQNVHNDGASNDNKVIAGSSLQDLRETGWEAFLEEVRSFWEKNSIPVPNMEDNMRIHGHFRWEGQVITHFHHFCLEIFYEAIDLIAQEMQNHFPKTSTKLPLLQSCFDPMDSFSKYNIHKLLRLAELYLENFTMTEHMMLEDQLPTFIYNVWHDADFINVGDLGGFARKMVVTSKRIIFPLIHRFYELALVLLVATVSVERVFTAMNIVKTDLRNKMGDEWMNDIMFVYINGRFCNY